MKKLLLAALLLSTSLTINLNAQTDFEDLTLFADTCWYGADQTGGFYSGYTYFVNYYNTTYNSWEGFAYSNMTDTVTPGYGNMYSAIAGSGNNNSENYGLAYASGFSGTTFMQYYTPLGSTINGIYITNNTYAYLSMQDGDAVAKKFGGTTGNDPDWFKLNMIGYNSGIFIDSVEFYLADYRFTNNSQDYIIKDWTFVDISSLNYADSIVFALSSTDNGTWGMNTPAYFCIDDITFTTNVSEFISDNISVYPNPVNDILTIDGIKNSQIEIRDITGKSVYTSKSYFETERIDVSNLRDGIYIVSLVGDSEIINFKIIKN